MTSTHLVPTTSSPGRGRGELGRLIIALLVILLLVVLFATQAGATVTEAESGAHIKPMPVAQYLKIKAQIRAKRAYYHAHPRLQVNHWFANASSGWLDPWPQ